MEISELTLKLILLLIPGSIACIIYEILVVHKAWNSFKFVTYSIIFGSISYLLAQSIWGIVSDNNDFILFWENLPTNEIPFKVIFVSSVVAVFVGFAASAIENFKVIYRIGKLLRITNKYGDESLFYYFLNSGKVEEVYIRDVENSLTYHGAVISFSESEDTYEIVLKDVVIYEYESSTELYKINSIYLSRNKNNLIIELPYIKEENGKEEISESTTN